VSGLPTFDFDAAGAERAAKAGQLEAWVDGYLRSGDWANIPLADGLHLAPRWWVGPLEVELDDLSPCVGSGAEYEYDFPAEQLNGWIDEIACQFPTDARFLPPMIAEFRNGDLSLRDGNKRYWAMRQLGWESCWTLIWFNDSAEYDAFTHRLEESRNESHFAQLSLDELTK
jgi:hypothetical protein